MQGPYYRRRGLQATIDFTLYEVDGVNFRTNASVGVGDIFIMKDEGAEASASNPATDEGRGYSLVLTSSEMQAKRIVIYVEDQSGTKVWLDDSIVVETTRHPNAMHEEGVTYANYAASATSSTLVLTSGPTDNSILKGQLITVVAGTGANQTAPVISYVGSTGVATISGAWAVIPDSTSYVEITGDAITEITIPSANDNANAAWDLNISAKTSSGTAGQLLNDVFTDTDNMQPKLGSAPGGTFGASLPALTSSGYMPVDVKEINATTVLGTGVTSDKWRGS